MNNSKLSKRLLTVLLFVQKGAVIADIGTDHAYLPCYAYQQGLITKAIAGELNDGPLKSAVSQVRQAGLEDIISVRKGNGLEVIDGSEVDTIIVAGMGGKLISDILEEGKEKLSGVSQLILQPNVAAHFVRHWMLENDWQLIAESIVEEDRKIYEVLSAVKGDGQAPYHEQIEHEVLLGPFLLKENSTVFQKKWQHELNKWEYIYQQLQQAVETEEILWQKQKLHRKISKVKEMLQ